MARVRVAFEVRPSRSPSIARPDRNPERRVTLDLDIARCQADVPGKPLIQRVVAQQPTPFRIGRSPP